MPDTPRQQPEPSTGAPMRFEATVHPGQALRALDAVADLDLDRVPDVGGELRLLVTAEDAERLVDQGYEVRLVQALRVRPLDQGLIMDDASAQSWLEARVAGIERQEDH